MDAVDAGDRRRRLRVLADSQTARAVSRLSQRGERARAQGAADTTAVHSLSPTTWLSGVRPKPTQGVDAYAGVTADQIAAQHIGQDTMLPSIELATEDHSGLIGACDRDYGCIYMNTLSWRTPTTPLPMEINPRDGVRADVRPGRHARRSGSRRMRTDRSILDAITSRRRRPRSASWAATRSRAARRVSRERPRDRAPDSERGREQQADLVAARARRSAFPFCSTSTSR